MNDQTLKALGKQLTEVQIDLGLIRQLSERIELHYQQVAEELGELMQQLNAKAGNPSHRSDS